MSRYLIYDSENLKSYQGLYPSFYINSSNGKVANNGQLSLTSYIRVNEGDTVEIVDFKSQRKPDMEKDREQLERYRRQLHIYAHLVEERTGKKVSKMHIYYTGEDSGVPTITYPYTKSAVEGTMAVFDDTVKKIMKNMI